MREDFTDLTLAEVAALHADRRAALAAASAEFGRVDAVCKLVAKRLTRFPEERLGHAVAALRLKRGQILPSGLLPSGTKTINRTGLLARARTKFGAGRTPTWLHNALKDRGGPPPMACDNGVWLYPRAEAEAWLDGLMSSLIDGKLPHDPVLSRRRARERIKREEQYRERAERERMRDDPIHTLIDPASQFAEAAAWAMRRAIADGSAPPSAPNVIAFPNTDSNDEPPGAA